MTDIFRDAPYTAEHFDAVFALNKETLTSDALRELERIMGRPLKSSELTGIVGELWKRKALTKYTCKRRGQIVTRIKSAVPPVSPWEASTIAVEPNEKRLTQGRVTADIRLPAPPWQGGCAV